MSDSVIISDNNPTMLFKHAEEMFNKGYRFVPARSNVYEWPQGLIDIDLYKQDLEITPVTFEEAGHVVVINHYDKIKFMIELQKYVLSGYTLDLNSVYYDLIGSKTCKVMNANHPNNIKYTLEELQEMKYEDLKQVAKLRNCFNRNKQTMIGLILRFQEE